MRLSPATAIERINERGALLVYPDNNQKEPPSIWSEFFPRSEMRWDWDNEGDDRVVQLWHLKTKLSSSKKVIYTKWYRGRATFFSRAVFTALLSRLNFAATALPRPGRNAQRALDLLNDNSPLSTKVLKKELDMRGRDNEGAYAKMLRELWERMLIVGFGEVDDGAFPSLAVASTQLIFEDLWQRARAMKSDEAGHLIQSHFGQRSAFTAFYVRLKKPAL